MSDLQDTPEPSLRDTLVAALEQNGNDQTSEATPAPIEGVQPHAPIETAEQKAERERDEKGRFAKSSEPGDTKLSEPASPQAAAEPSASSAITPPASWRAAAKAEFAKLPPVIQEEVLKREKDIEAGNAQWQAKAERFNRLDAVLAPRRERFQLAGIDETQAVQALFAAQDFLERNPVEGIRYLARQYGVNLAAFAGQTGQAVQEPPMHPVIQQLAAQVQTLQQALSQQQTAQAQAAQSQYASEVEKFSSDPANLYFENVRGDMANLIRAGQASSLKDAYEKAIWAHPEIRPILLQQQVEERARQAQEAARAKARDAKYAAGSVTGSPAPGMSPANSGPAPTLRDELKAAFENAA